MLLTVILRFDHVHDIIVTSYVKCLCLFWYVWKEETHGYTMIQKKKKKKPYGGSVFKLRCILLVSYESVFIKGQWF